MKLRFKKDSSKKKNKDVLVNKVDRPKDLYGDMEVTSLNFFGKL